MSTPSAHETDGNLLYTAGLLTGGLVLGFGIMLLPWSFGWTGGDCLNCNADESSFIRIVGFSALENIETLGAADYSIGMIVLGFLTLVAINATAWRRTGGY